VFKLRAAATATTAGTIIAQITCSKLKLACAAQMAQGNLKRGNAHLSLSGGVDV